MKDLVVRKEVMYKDFNKFSIIIGATKKVSIYVKESKVVVNVFREDKEVLLNVHNYFAYTDLEKMAMDIRKEIIAYKEDV